MLRDLGSRWFVVLAFLVLGRIDPSKLQRFKQWRSAMLVLYVDPGAGAEQEIDDFDPFFRISWRRIFLEADDVKRRPRGRIRCIWIATGGQDFLDLLDRSWLE